MLPEVHRDQFVTPSAKARTSAGNSWFSNAILLSGNKFLSVQIHSGHTTECTRIILLRKELKGEVIEPCLEHLARTPRNNQTVLGLISLVGESND